MNIKELKKMLKEKDASWTIPDESSEALALADVAEPHHLGALPSPSGELTARMPRIRRAEDGKFFLWQEDTLRLSRDAVPTLPKVWDWRNVNNKNWINTVRNQGGCGSCVAFATAAAVESHQRIETSQANLQIDLSEASLFFVNNRQCNYGDPNYGWYVTSALNFLESEGICFEVNYPYHDINQKALLIQGTEKTFKIHGFDSTTQTAQMKRWLCEDGPLVTTFDVYEDFPTFFDRGTGVYQYVAGTGLGGHAVLTVGYDDNQGCWICKNSWGAKQTHPDGCFKIGYGQCGIDSRMYLIQDVYDIFTVDELPYNPRNLRIIDEGPNGWLLTDGVSRMKMFDNREDARNGLRVARRYNRHGFIGRDNSRNNRIDYITEYWSGNSGLPYEPLTKVDCIPYHPNNVVAEDLDAQGWRIKDGNHWMLLANDMNDALAILRIVERYTKMCFIGRGNKRPNRKNYIMTYWE